MSRAVTPHSVPLAGFLNPSAVSSKLELRGFVSRRNRSWVFLLQRFPLTKIACPSRGRQLPCGSSPACEVAPSGPYCLRFPQTPTLPRPCLPPPKTMERLFTAPKRSFPSSLGTGERDQPVPPAPSTSKRSSLCESVPNDASCPTPPVDPLLKFRPSEVFSSRSSEPQPV